MIIRGEVLFPLFQRDNEKVRNECNRDPAEQLAGSKFKEWLNIIWSAIEFHKFSQLVYDTYT